MTDTQNETEQSTRIDPLTPLGRYKRTGVIPIGHAGEVARYLREQREHHRRE